MSKDLEQQLKESEERFRILAESAQEGVVLSENMVIVEANQKFASMFGFKSPKHAVGTKLQDLVHPDSMELVSRKIQEPDPEPYDVQALKRDGSTIIVKSKGKHIPYHGRNIRLSVITDITSQRQAEESVIVGEARYKQLFEDNVAGVFLSEVGGGIIEANMGLAQIFGFASVDELKKANAKQLYYSEEERASYLSLLRKKGVLKNHQMRMRTIQGDELWILENVKFTKDESKNKEFIEGTLIDITETKRIEQALQEREENYKSLIEHTPDGILIHNEKGEVLFANPAALQMIGFSSLQEAVEKNLFHYVHPDYHEAIRNQKGVMGHDGDAPFFKIKVQRPGGKEVDVEIKTNRITYQGEPGVEVVMHDISLQLQLEREHMRLQLEEESNRELKREIASHIRTRQRLNANQKYTRLLLDSSIDAICASDMEGKLTEFNKAGMKLLGYDSSEIEKIKMSQLVHPPEQWTRIEKKIIQGGNFSGEITHQKKDGTKFIAYLSASLLKNERGENIGTMSISRDITGIKEAEEQLKRSVQEKETLLKEIHHRVKNNMQVISSILKLQTAYVKDQKAIDLLNECRDRIASMAFIHATLYMTNDFENIDFADYVSNIASNLHQSYVVANKRIELKLDVPKVSLHIDDAIPCGLIINELLSNSFKYAFSKKEKGSVGISVKVKKESIILAIWDDGAGFPKDVDYRNSESLGLQLVMSLTEQIRGKITLETRKDEGTKFIIAFRKAK